MWLVVGLPLVAVVASAISAVLAYRGGDVPLPARYHWEGSQLGADQARLDAAARRGIGADFTFDVATGQCRVVLQGATPATLQLDLAHATLGGVDQHVALQRDGAAYTGACAPLARGHWWLQLADPGDDWLLRQRIAR
ncbi:MAG: FixH family protein [Steroidobacteraceae bacterium]